VGGGNVCETTLGVWKVIAYMDVGGREDTEKDLLRLLELGALGGRGVEGGVGP